MRQLLLTPLGVAALIGLFGATPASADPITITSGFTIGTLTNGSYQFNGAGLSVAADVEDGWTTTVANRCSPCDAAAPVMLSFSSTCESCISHGTSGNLLGGTVYPAPTTFAATLAFHGPSFSSSDVSADHLTFTAPFTMTGSLAAFTSLSDPNPPFFSTDLIGSGLATISFTRSVGGLFDAENIRYDFSSAPSPTPEPASLLLFGSGAALLSRRRRWATSKDAAA